MERQNDFQNDEIEIDLKDLLFEILIYWKWIVLATIITAGITFAVSKFVIIPQYESTSELYVLSKSTSITSLADIQTGSSLTNDYIVVVKGRPGFRSGYRKSWSKRNIYISWKQDNPGQSIKLTCFKDNST